MIAQLIIYLPITNHSRNDPLTTAAPSSDAETNIINFAIDGQPCLRFSLAYAGESSHVQGAPLCYRQANRPKAEHPFDGLIFPKPA